MKKNKLFLIAFLCIAIYSQAQSWTKVGNVQFSVADVYNPHVAIANDGTPYVIYKEGGDGNFKATVMKYANSVWSTVGARSFSYSDIYEPVIAIDGNNTPYAAFKQNKGGSWNLWVLKFDGTNWVEVGGAAVSAGDCSHINIAIDNNNNVFVGYRDHSLNYTACVKKFDGTNWNYVGVPSFSVDQVDNLCMNVDHNNVPYVAFREVNKNYKGSIMKFDGTNWVYVGVREATPEVITNPDATTGAAAISMTALNGNIPTLLYIQDGNGYKVIAKKYQGSTWSDVVAGTTQISVGTVSYQDIVSSGSFLYATYRDHSLGYKGYVQKFDGTSWSNLGTQPFAPNVVNSNNIKVDNARKTVYVVVRDESAGNVGNLWSYVDQTIVTNTKTTTAQYVKYSQFGNKIVFSNLKCSQITIHGLDGKLIFSDKKVDGNNYSITLNKGVYIIHADRQSFKVII